MNAAVHVDSGDLALFAMRALDAEPSRTIEEHLALCAFCRQELAHLQGDLATFAHAVEMRPPAAGVRDRILHTVTREKKTPPPEPRPALVFPVSPLPQSDFYDQRTSEAMGRPIDEFEAVLERLEALRGAVYEEQESQSVSSESFGETPQSPAQDEIDPQPRIGQHVWPEVPSMTPPPGQAPCPASSLAQPAEEEPPLLHSHRRSQPYKVSENEVRDGDRSGSLVGRLIAALGWVAALCLAGAAGWLSLQRRDLRTRMTAQSGEIEYLKNEQDGARRLLDMMTDPTTRQFLLRDASEASTDDEAQGRVLYSPQRGALLFLGSGLKPTTVEKTYELWLVPTDGRDPIPAGVFHPEAKGDARVVLPSLPRGTEAKAFGVTIEDEGGAQAPTLPILLAGN
jgi:hypothetical protein